MQKNVVKVWYKQFWPWFLIIVPATSMVLSLTMLNFAFNSKDSMVIDDYYKEGKGINLVLQKIERARELNISALTTVTDSAISIQITSGEIAEGEALSLAFFHATQNFKDFSVTLLKDAQGHYRAPLDKPLNGKWKVILQPLNQEWKIQQVLALPQAQAFVLAP
ncbi:FixH family protein [Paraglaciecola aestuariivivens]